MQVLECLFHQVCRPSGKFGMATTNAAVDNHCTSLTTRNGLANADGKQGWTTVYQIRRGRLVGFLPSNDGSFIACHGKQCVIASHNRSCGVLGSH